MSPSVDRDLVQMVGTIENIQAGLREKRERNRQNFPFVTACVDTLNAAGLGPVRVIFAEENGNRVGREP